MYSTDSRWPHKKKFKRVKSGDLAGHSLPTHPSDSAMGDLINIGSVHCREEDINVGLVVLFTQHCFLLHFQLNLLAKGECILEYVVVHGTISLPIN